MLNAKKVFIYNNQASFSAKDLQGVEAILSNKTEEEMLLLNTVRFKDTFFGLFLSCFFGVLGVDRFYAGDIGLGLLKLFTFGGLGIWWLIDLFVLPANLRQKNYKLLQEITSLN